MADEAVGTGYVLIKPKMDEGALGDLESKGKQGGVGFGGAFQVAAGNLISSAVQTMASAAVDILSDAFNNFADYEQLVGGVETMFKESADIVQQNAAAAYRTAGLSANEYMEQVTSFSASLLQSLGGDTVKAAEYADTALRDMSDNANKMGSSMESITNAYQGFAKQNYTMLDNLKLGYGGTKGEMERLLKDASALAGIEFDINNYSDVIQAIHVIQESMGIAGTTSKEATETISGSINKLQSSWQNFLTGIFDENADMGALGEQLLDSLSDVLANVIPRIVSTIGRAIMGLPGAIIDFLRSIPSVIAPTIMQIFGDELGGQINDAFFDMFENLAKLVESVVSAITPILDTVVSIVVEHVIPTVIQVAEIVNPILEEMAKNVTAAMNVIGDIITVVMDVIKAVIDAVWPYIQGVVEGASAAITAAIQALQPIADFVTNLFNSVKAAIENPMEAAKNFIGNIIETIKGLFNFTISWPHIPTPHPYISPPGWTLGDLLHGSIPSIGIDWYAKGGIVDGPTLIGAGEAGAEAIVPLTQPALAPFAQSVAAQMNMSEIVTLLRQIAAKDDKIYLDGKTLVGGISSRMDNALGNRRAMSARGLA